MATFTSVSNELICEILRYVKLEDFEKFAQISHNVHSLAFPFLTEHRALIRKYSTFCACIGTRSITQLLGTILASPRIGSYVRKVALGTVLDRPFIESKVEYTKEELEIFTTAALDSACLRKPSEEEILDEEDFWSNEIRNGNDDILLAILLPLLPNLATLAADTHPARIQWYEKALEQAGFTKEPTLSKLALIRLDCSMRYGFHLSEIQKFSALPSVTAITAMKACGLDCLHDISPDTSSNVTHLKLWQSSVDSKGLYEFLQGFPKLQSFTYSHTDEPEPPPEAFLIRASLLAHCKATLQNLTLLDPRCRRISFMGSLRGFEALKELYTEWYFLGPVRGSCTLQLDEHLRASLVRLKIHDSKGRTKSEYEKVIKCAQHAKEHHQQNFKWVVFGGTRVEWSLENVDWSLRKTCLNMGISLIFSPYAPKSGD